MPVKASSLKVHPNPWLYIDHLGRPAGRVAVEQPKGSYDPRTVGSRIKNAELVHKAADGLLLAHDVHDIEIEYDTEPIKVPNTDYYRRRVMKGELIAADRDSYRDAGGRPKDFEAHQQHVEAKKAEAIKLFDLENGEGAFEALAAQREEAAQTRANEKAATSPEALAKAEADAAKDKLAADAKRASEAKAAAGEQPAPEPAKSTTTAAPAASDQKKGDAK